MGDFGAARAAYERAAALRPGAPDASRGLQELRELELHPPGAP
jgi:hypothetical protein